MGVLSDLNRKRKKVTKKIFNPIVKGFSKLSDKLIPNELRFLEKKLFKYSKKLQLKN